MHTPESIRRVDQIFVGRSIELPDRHQQARRHPLTARPIIPLGVSTDGWRKMLAVMRPTH
jgi:hypothetical protein